ncbi:MAG: YegS/Rv2252/BmrU family lipid kinase [Hyphomicrobiales bacterium]|nr:YegS/Rv2252/BmrU family lipid kinase [Hyphomicrobiales bacterium]
MRLHLITNPIAGSRHYSRLEETLALLRRRGAEVVEFMTRGPDDCGRLVNIILKDGASRIAIAGGDGTIREVIEALSRARPDGDCPVGLVPAGTANVVAHEIGLTTDPDAVASVLLSDDIAEIRPGLANDRLFVFSCGVGFDAQAVASVNPRLKAAIGPGAYVASALTRIVARRPDRFTVTVGAADHTVESVIIAKARHYAGGYVLAGEADMRDEAFQVCLFRYATRLHMALFGAALIAGGASRLSNATTLSATAVRIDGADDQPVQLDGDIVTHLPCDVVPAPHTVPLLVPHAYLDRARPSP